MQPAETTILLADFTTEIYTRSVGYTLQWDSNIDLTGKTVEMVYIDINGLRRIATATVSEDGTFATVVTDQNMFTVAGITQLQFEIVNGSSPNFTYTVAGVVHITVLQSL